MSGIISEIWTVHRNHPYLNQKSKNTVNVKGDAVGHTTPNQRAPYVERLSLALLLPRYLLIRQVVLMGGFGMVILGVMGLMSHANFPVNPFTAYLDVFPGQSQVALRLHGFTCWLQNNYNEPTESRCGLNVKTSDFSHIEAVCSKGVIHQITFDLRDSPLNVGELTEMLGPPVIRFVGSVSFNWRGNFGIARIGNPPKRFSLFGRVWQVMLTDIRWNRS